MFHWRKKWICVQSILVPLTSMQSLKDKSKWYSLNFFANNVIHKILYPKNFLSIPQNQNIIAHKTNFVLFLKSWKQYNYFLYFL